MNCFDVRQEFRAFWRKELEPNRRAEFSAHLEECPRCDLAFRTFALSAPVLHSEREPAPVPIRAVSVSARPHPQPSYPARFQHRTWASMGAAAAMLVAGIFAAYFSVNVPVQSVSDAISQPSPLVEIFGADVTETGSDLAG